MAVSAAALLLFAGSGGGQRSNGDGPVTHLAQPRLKEGWLGRHANQLEALLRHRGTRMLFVGDSLVQEWESVGRAPWNDAFGHLSALNAGIGGDRIENIAWRVEQMNRESLASMQAFVVHAGTNNLATDSAAQIVDSYQYLLSAIRTAAPGAEIYVTALFPRAARQQQLQATVDAVNASLRALCAGQSLHFLEVPAEFIGLGGAMNDTLSRDGVHLNAQGYRLWGEALRNALQGHRRDSAR